MRERLSEAVGELGRMLTSVESVKADTVHRRRDFRKYFHEFGIGPDDSPGQPAVDTIAVWAEVEDKDSDAATLRFDMGDVALVERRGNSV